MQFSTLARAREHALDCTRALGSLQLSERARAGHSECCRSCCRCRCHRLDWFATCKRATCAVVGPNHHTLTRLRALAPPILLAFSRPRARAQATDEKMRSAARRRRRRQHTQLTSSGAYRRADAGARAVISAAAAAAATAPERRRFNFHPHATYNAHSAAIVFVFAGLCARACTRVCVCIIRLPNSRPTFGLTLGANNANE